MSRFATGVLSGLVVLALSGCASAATGVPAPTIAAAEPPSTPAAEVRGTPEFAFGGDCAVLATTDELAAATGSTLEQQGPGPEAGVLAFRALGGIGCSWSVSAGQTGGVSLTALPFEVVGLPVIERVGGAEPHCYGSYVGDEVQEACSFGSLVGQWWFAGIVYTAAGSGLDPREAIGALGSSFASRAAAAGPAPFVRPDGAWASVPECEVLDASVDMSQSFGTDLTASSGNLPGEEGPGFYGAIEASGQRSCSWEGGAPSDRTAARAGCLVGDGGCRSTARSHARSRRRSRLGGVRPGDRGAGRVQHPLRLGRDEPRDRRGRSLERRPRLAGLSRHGRTGLTHSRIGASRGNPHARSVGREVPEGAPGRGRK